ncbi:MAG: hypothetical protein NTW52_00790 [Planctomycetota bacterium]|nr:hypothetical protein [Planctomycetota bacterium]
MYDTREKAARDHQWLINGARNEGLEVGREEGLEQGKLLGTIRTCQSILGLTKPTEEELSQKPLEELRSLATELQSTLGSRVV